MNPARNEEQEEAIRADLKGFSRYCGCPDCAAKRERLHRAGFRPCVVELEVLGPDGGDAQCLLIARNDDEAKDRAADLIRENGITGTIIPLSVTWKK